MKHGDTAASLPLDAILTCAIEAARSAGDYALAQAQRRTDVLQAYAHDVKLKLDVESQEEACLVIRRRFPDHDILGEEDPRACESAADSPRVLWVIDPIDGTVNFSHGMPMWCCSVAALWRGQTIAGAVYAPALNECYSAASDRPSLRNGEAIHVSGVSSLERAMVLTGLDKNLDPRLPPFEVFRAISVSVQKARILGAAALDICRVASGQADGYFESGIYLWDVAAARLIVQQAGGTAETIRKMDAGRLQFVASNGLIQEALKSTILKTEQAFGIAASVT